MKISIGTPPVDAFVILDTGSDLTWIQCEPCVECFKQLRPIFNPKNSSSYKTVSCNTKLCQQVWSPTPCNNNTCNYKVTYADGSPTLGDLSVETFRFSSTSGKHVSIPKIAFGCGHNNSGFSNTTSGLIGLAGGDVSIVNQMHQEIKGKFSYCLIPVELLSIDSNATSHISFGDYAVVSGPGVVSTPLIPGQSLYYLTLESISIGNKIFPFKSSKISSNTQGKILIDSGTLLTYFPHKFYAKLEKTLVASINATRKHDTSGFFNVCYASKNDIINAPKIVAHFTNADVELSLANVFTQMDESLIFLTMLPDEAFATFGNLAQANFLIGFATDYNFTEFEKIQFKKYDESNCGDLHVHGYDADYASCDNFTEWKEKILLTLGCSKLDLTHRVEEPSKLMESSMPKSKTFCELWERSNHLSLMLIKAHIIQIIRMFIPYKDNVKAYMKSIDEQFVSSDKALSRILMKRLSNMTFIKSRTVCENIMDMRDIVFKLESLEVDMSSQFVVYFILNSLPTEYDPFKISYNTHKDNGQSINS
ncbi:hypothetical protein BC332_20613 [Capsicum chinense]|nr:hypothetical protein BC332_20613 [Capsicum chinense]